MLERNKLLNETYLIKDRIGSGGGGIIYKAYHMRMRKYVAIKLIKDSVKSDFYNRSEVDVLKNLKNDYLPQVLDFVEDGDDVYTVMEFIEGRNFKQLISNGKVFNEKQVKKYAYQLCEAVKYLHNHVPPIIHSDIKPANVMLTPSDNICLIDFNISMMSDNGIAVSKGGSRDFGAPEQFRRVINAPYEVDEFHEETRFIENEETEILTNESEIYNSKSAKTKNVSKAYIDMRTDIYGIGATIYYMLTSRVPVGGRADFRGINCSSAIKDAIEKAMNPEPAKRFRTVFEFEAALKRHISVKRIVLPVVAGASVLSFGFGIWAIIQNSYKSPQNEVISYNVQSNTIAEQTYEQAIAELYIPIIEVDTKLTSTMQNTPELFPVPDLVGLSKIEAIAVIENAGLSYELASAESDTVEKDHIISQNIPADANVPTNYKILITVSEGKTITVPSLINKSITEATSILENAGISYSVKYEDDSRVDKDNVFKQSISSGTKIDPKTQITIYVSNHEALSVVPYVINKSYSDAISELKKANLKYKIVYEDDNRVKYGYVFSQSIKSGQEVKEGTEVTIGVSTHSETVTQQQPTSVQPKPSVQQQVNTPDKTYAPEEIIEMTSVPNVVGMSSSDAVNALKKAQLNYDIEFMDDGVTKKNTVFKQSIVSGKYVEVNTKITLYVSSHEESEIEVEENATPRPAQDSSFTLPVRMKVSLDNAVMPIEGTKWSDYNWKSSNSAKLKISSGIMTTYSVGKITITATLKNDETKVFTTQVKVVRQDEYFSDQTATTTVDSSWFYDLYNETAFSIHIE